MTNNEDLARDSNREEFQSETPPEEVTESYGTGVKAEPGDNIGDHSLQHEMGENAYASPELTGGDVDAAWQRAADVGDEAVGGTVSTPDQDIVDDLGKAVGLEMDDRAFLRTNEVLEQRDNQRWELDPMSSEDYQEHGEVDQDLRE